MRSSKYYPIILFLFFSGPLAFNALGQRTLSVISSDPRLKTAFELMERRNYQGAIAEMRSFLNRSEETGQPTNTAVAYYMAHCAMQLSHPDAEEQMLLFLKENPGSAYQSRAWFDLGLYYFKIRKWDSAVDYLTRSGGENLQPDLQAEADYKAGLACFQAQQFDRAKSFFQKIRGNENRYLAPASYYLAYLHFRDNQLDEALNYLGAAVRSPEHKAGIPVLKAGILYRKRQFDEVISFGEATFKDTARFTGKEELHMLVGESYYNKKDYKSAAVQFDEYARAVKNPGKPLQFRMAFSWFKTDQTDKAIGGFRQAAAKVDTTGGRRDTITQMASYYLGVCYLKKDQKQFALSAFDQASLLDGDPRIQETSWFNAGKLSYDLEKYNDAVEILKDFSASHPSSEYYREAQELIGEGLLNSNDFDAALAYMEKSKAKSDRLNMAYQRAAYQQGTILFNDGKTEKARELFTQSAKYALDKETALAAAYWNGECQLKLRQYAQAAQEFAYILRAENATSSPYYLKARYGSGYAHYNQKDYSRALGFFKDYIQELEKNTQKPFLADACLRLADCYYATKNYPLALRSYDKAIDARTADLDYAFYQKGLVYAAMKDYENARTNFSVVVEKYQKSKWYDGALFQKAQMDYESSNYQAAIRGYSNMISNMPESPVIPYCYLNRGTSAANLKEYPAAVADFKKILEDYPAHPAANSAILGLQEALVQTGEIEQLNEYIGKFKKANPGSESLESIEFETSKALYNGQKYAKAITGFQDYLKTYPGSSYATEARFYLAESFYRSGSKQEALPIYRELTALGRSNWFIRSSFRIAELEYAAGNFQVSAAQYGRLLDGVAKTAKDINNANLGLIENLFQLGKFDSVSLISSDLLKKENLSPDVFNKASLYSAKVLVSKGEYEKAMDELLNTVNNAQDINGAEAQYLVADVFFRQKKYNESLAALFELKSRFATYPKWYNKGFLLMADNYVAQKEYFQAQATLNSIIENAKDKETVAGAKSRLAALKSEMSSESKP